jgi:hypothetical protein
MSKSFQLTFQGTTFSVPKGNLISLFERRPDLVATARYEVQSSVPLEVFQVFAKAVETGSKVPVTKEAVDALSLLAAEFGFDDLLLDCRALQAESNPGLIAYGPDIAMLSERVSNIEHQLSLSLHHLTGFSDLKTTVANHAERLETLRSDFSGIETTVAALRTELAEMLRSPKEIECPFLEANRLDGILTLLARKHGGNVHDKGIVTITSKSVYAADPVYSVRNLADLTSMSYFHSADGPGQWIC